MAEVNYYQAEYGIPTATAYYKQQYWRFKDWQRLMANLGGSFPLLDGGYVKARLYYVKYYNVLDAYKNDQFSHADHGNRPSTTSPWAPSSWAWCRWAKRTSCRPASPTATTTSAPSPHLNAPWEHYEHKTLSLGLEDHFRVSEKVELMAGASLDHLSKQDGENKTTLNPILGVKFNPSDWVDLHLTLSQKSHFPSMKNLYSLPDNGGNPDLRDEIGTNVEFGFTYDRGWYFSGAVFYNDIRDMIESRINADFIKQNINVARAKITGFELEARKTFGPFSAGGQLHVPRHRRTRRRATGST